MSPPRIEPHLRIGAEALPRPAAPGAQAAGAPGAEAAAPGANVAVARVEFTVDGRPLGATPEWSRAASVAGPALAACLGALARDEERLFVALSTAVAHHEATEEGLRVQLRAQDAAYLRFALGRDAESYAYVGYGDEDNRHSELVFQAQEQWLHEIVALGWSWYSFRAYAGEPATAAQLHELLDCEDPERRRQMELERFVCVAEDWTDGTALRISSARLSEEQLAARVDMSAIQQALSRGG